MTKIYSSDWRPRSLRGQSTSHGVSHSSVPENLVSPGTRDRACRFMGHTPEPQNQPVNRLRCEADVLWFESKYLRGGHEIGLFLFDSVTPCFHWLLVKPGAFQIYNHQQLRRLMNQVNSNFLQPIFSHHLYATAYLEYATLLKRNPHSNPHHAVRREALLSEI